jgi:hypothetical protein
MIPGGSQMKTLVRFIMFVALLSLVLPLAAVGAQEGSGEDQLVAVPEISAVYYLSAASGSFADQGDGTYLLTLEGVGPEVIWIMTAPSLAIQQQNNVNLNAQWTAAEGLTTDAVIEAAGLNISMTLAAPVYDEATGVQTFVATVTDITAPEGVKEPAVPATFDAANLSLVWSMEFQNGLVGGIQAMYAGMRATPEECAAAQQQWNDYNTWATAKYQEFNTASYACWQGDKAACSTANAIVAEINARYATVSGLPAYLNAECKR